MNSSKTAARQSRRKGRVIPRKRAHLETGFQKTAIAFLRLALPTDAMVVGYPLGCFPAGLSRDQIAKLTAFWAAMGALDGFPDLFVLYRGWFFGMELKWEGAVAKNQVERHSDLRRCGCEVVVCRNLADISRQCISFGIPLRTTI